MLTIDARRYETGEPVRIHIEGSQIASVEPIWPVTPLADWPWVAPGLFDLQVNGYGGVWFCQAELTPTQVAEAVRPYLAAGVTRLCPTLITNSFTSLAAGFTAIRQACEQEPWLDRMVAGCHLEGPYLSGEDGPRGAHPRSQIRPADWDEFRRLQEASGQRICLVTIAPEVEGALPFIQQAVASGVTVSIGHTAANSRQIEAAVDAGARLSTHLGNGAHGTLRRHPNYIWDQLGDPRLHASLITDGHHLPASVVRTMIRAKSPQQIILTCDASGWAGCPTGEYTNELGAVEVLEDGRIVVAGQRQLLAGAGLLTDTCVLRAMEFADLDLAVAIDMASRNPAKLLGFEISGLKAGGQADLFLFRTPTPGAPRLEVVATLSCGVVQYGKLPG